MAVHRPTYATRQDVKSALDIALTADYDAQIDSALQAGAEDVDRLTKRRFYNVIETKFWDWPSFQSAYPWRIWFDAAELADVTVNVPTVTTGGQSIPNSAIFWGNPRYSPPYTYMELDRSQSYGFGVGDTPQRDVSILGAYGYWLRTRPAGSLAGSVSSTTATTITVTDASLAGVGDVLTIDSEGLLVQDCGLADTGQQQTGGGVSTASDADVALTVATGSDLYTGEVVQLDTESMLITAIAGNTCTVERAVNGSVIAEHTDAEVYAYRLLTVQRGFGGTTAATHSNSTAIVAALVPGMVHELNLAEALNYVLQKTSGYARTVGENMTIVPGGSLPDLRSRVQEKYGRKARQRVI